MLFATGFVSSQAQDTLEADSGEPVSCDNIELLKEVLDDVEMYRGRNPRIKELQRILTNPHFKVPSNGHSLSIRIS